MLYDMLHHTIHFNGPFRRMLLSKCVNVTNLLRTFYVSFQTCMKHESEKASFVFGVMGCWVVKRFKFGYFCKSKRNVLYINERKAYSVLQSNLTFLLKECRLGSILFSRTKIKLGKYFQISTERKLKIKKAV